MAAWRCTSFECPAQASEKIKQFASRKALDIEGIGETVAEALVANGGITSVLELYNHDLAYYANLNLGTVEDPRRFGEKNAAKVVAALEASKTKSLEKWLFALGIPQVGESAAKELSRLHETLRDVASSQELRYLRRKTSAEAELKPLKAKKAKKTPEETARYNELQGELKIIQEHLAPFKITECGGVVAGNVESFFTGHQGFHLLETLYKLGIYIQSENFDPKPSTVATGDKPLTGKTFVITGTLSKDRDQFKDLLISKGAKVSGAISAKTSYLLCGEGGGGKRAKAEELNVPVIDEAGLETLLAQG